MNNTFPQQPATGQLYNNGNTTYVFDGAKWSPIGVVEIGNYAAAVAVGEIDTDEEENLEQTVEILRELNNSYKDEIQRLKTEVSSLSSDLHALRYVDVDDPRAVVEYIIELQKAIRDLEKRSALIAPNIGSYTSDQRIDVVTVALPTTDRMQVAVFRDPMTFSNQVHLAFKSSDGVFRHSTSSLEDLAKQNFPVQAVSETFDAMAAALKKDFIDAVYKNSR